MKWLLEQGWYSFDLSKTFGDFPSSNLDHFFLVITKSIPELNFYRHKDSFKTVKVTGLFHIEMLTYSKT